MKTKDAISPQLDFHINYDRKLLIFLNQKKSQSGASKDINLPWI